MAILTANNIGSSGLTIHSGAMAAATLAGDSFPNSGRTYVVFENTSGGPLGVNFDSPAVDNFGFSGNALDVLKSVPAGEKRIFGPFSQGRHNDSNERVQMTYPDGVTGLKVKVFNA
jgi:hypothetical protein